MFIAAATLRRWRSYWSAMFFYLDCYIHVAPLEQCISSYDREVLLHDFEFEIEFLAAQDRRQVELPELPHEPK